MRGFATSLTRSSRYARVTPEDVAFFQSLDPSIVITDASALEPMHVDWMKKYRSDSPVQLALKPRNADQISKILQHCNSRKLAVTPQGGNTGLVGGSIPVFDEIVISMSRMNEITRICPDTNTVSCEAGVILESLETALEALQMTIPIDLGAKGSCQIGGNVATNAGGIHLLRYGSLHGCVLGLQVVLADGTLLNLDSEMRKDNTGFDLKQLFIGSEGSLGIITNVTLAVPPLPQSRAVAFLACETFDQIRKLLILAKCELGESLSAFELLDNEIISLCETHIDGVKSPLNSKHSFYALIEVAGSNEDHNNEKMANFSEKAFDRGLVVDGTISQDETQRKSIWRLRESAPEGILHFGKPFKYDISLPLSSFYEIVTEVRKRVGIRGKVVGYGHMGDCNLHLNIASDDSEILDILEPFIWDFVAEKKGSISAEHGVGLQKVNKLHYSKSAAAIDMIRATKRTFDPNLILNPYKCVPLDY